jgi:hypothetical protein
MSGFAFIDESGTKDDQLIMTVSMIVLDGQFACKNIQKSILKELYPKKIAKKQSKKDITKPRLGLHYCDIASNDRLTASRILIERKIDCYASCYYHDGREKHHEERFAIYKSMVRTCILAAFEHHEDLEIYIAAQGGANEYRSEFLAELRLLPEKFRLYRKVKFGLETNAHAGIQIADFYAGAIRDFLLSQLQKQNELAHAYDVIKSQIGEIAIETGPAPGDNKSKRMSFHPSSLK